MNEPQSFDDWGKHVFKLMKGIKRDVNQNPVTLEGCIRSIILKNPDMCQYRDQALDLIYCTLGTGINWNKFGRLGDSYPNNYLNMPPNYWSCSIFKEKEHGLDESLKGMRRKNNPEFNKHLDIFENEIQKENNKKVQRAIKTVKEIDKRVVSYSGKPRWYPISWYASHFCVPDNAQKDFVNGAIETLQLILRSKNRARYLDHKAHMRDQQNKNYAKWMLKVLEARIKYDL